MATAGQICQRSKQLWGRDYDYGAAPDPRYDKDPSGADCSGYIRWVFGMEGIILPTGSWIQRDFLAKYGRQIPKGVALWTPASVLIEDGTGVYGHIVGSLGNGWSFEAKSSRLNKKYGGPGGIGSWPIDINFFDSAWTVPGVTPGPAGGPLWVPQTTFSEGVEMNISPDTVMDALVTDMGSWQLTADGGVVTVAGQFYGSYPALPEKDRQGFRVFFAITKRVDGRPDGYTIWANDRSKYSFPV